MRPTLILEVSYEDPADDPIWVDESSYLRRPWNTNRGRSTELDKQEPGTASFTLDNRTGRFDPWNASGAHFPNVIPMRRIRLSTNQDSGAVPFTTRVSSVRSTHVLRGGTVDLYLFTGFIESWSQTWMAYNGDSNVTIRCVDGFAVFNLAVFMWGYRYDAGTGIFACGTDASDIVPDTGPPFIPDDLTGARINRVLDCIGWPTADRTIDEGTITVAGNLGGANLRTNQVALSHLQQIADTEGGLLFIDAGGMVRFIDAAHLPDSPDASEVYGGQTGEIGYSDISTAPSDTSRLWNVTTVGGQTTVAASDATSQAHYYERPFTIQVLDTGSFADLNTRRDALLARYKDAIPRVDGLVLRPTHQSDWFHILMHELGDFIHVMKRPPGADVIEEDLRIEGISISSGTDTNTTPTVTFKLSS
jgi:hypothetical protein